MIHRRITICTIKTIKEGIESGMTKTVNIDEAKTTLHKLLSLVTSGNEVIIAKDNKPIAKIIPISHPVRARVAGLNKGKIWISEDFDEPLP